MAYDPYSRVYRPDMQTELPAWQDMGDGQENQQTGQNAGTVMGLLRQRIGAKPAAKGGMMGGNEGKASALGMGKVGAGGSL